MSRTTWKLRERQAAALIDGRRYPRERLESPRGPRRDVLSNRSADVGWRFSSLRSGYERTARLQAYWEVELDPMSDDDTPDEIGAIDLFRKWAARIQEGRTDPLIPIYWYVEAPDRAVLEGMPFQDPRNWGSATPPEDFLTHFTWPVDSSGTPLNWLTLPVVDKRWNRTQADKGGFIQEATGWKPSILQPVIYLPALMSILQ
jgi:hypothetical protein